MGKGIIFTLDSLIAITIMMIFISSFYFIQDNSYEINYFDKANDLLLVMNKIGILGRLNQTEIGHFLLNNTRSFYFNLDCYYKNNSKAISYFFGNLSNNLKIATTFFTSINGNISFPEIYETHYSILTTVDAAYDHEVYLHLKSPYNSTIKVIKNERVTIFPNGEGEYLLAESSHGINGKWIDIIVEGIENTTITPYIYVKNTGEWVYPWDYDPETGKPFVNITDFGNGTIIYGFEDLKGQPQIDWDYNDVVITVIQTFQMRINNTVSSNYLNCKADLAVR